MADPVPPKPVREATPQEKLRFGDKVRIHPITGMPLEMGIGAGPDHAQAVFVHVPQIRATQGDKAADDMLARLEAHVAELAKKPEHVHALEAEAAKIEEIKQGKLADIERLKGEIAQHDKDKAAKLDEAKKAQAEHDKPKTKAPARPAPWAAETTYAKDQKATGPDGLVYSSLVDSNTGHVPSESPLEWAAAAPAVRPAPAPLFPAPQEASV